MKAADLLRFPFCEIQPRAGPSFSSRSMQPCSPALALLLLAACSLPASGSPAEPSCLHFPQLLPAKLKELRIKFEEIKDYFVSITLQVSSSPRSAVCFGVRWMRGEMIASSWNKFGRVLCDG